MSDATALLRLLEPAVRPAGLPVPTRLAGGGAGAAGPIEARSFESLLEEARGMAAAGDPLAAAEAGAEGDDPAAPPATPGPLRGLAGMDRIENPSLRRLVGGT